MTVHEQAYLLTAEIFVLSFAAIYVIWFADRVRRNFLGNRPVGGPRESGLELKCPQSVRREVNSKARNEQCARREGRRPSSALDGGS